MGLCVHNVKVVGQRALRGLVDEGAVDYHVCEVEKGHVVAVCALAVRVNLYWGLEGWGAYVVLNEPEI